MLHSEIDITCMMIIMIMKTVIIIMESIYTALFHICDQSTLTLIISMTDQDHCYFYLSFLGKMQTMLITTKTPWKHSARLPVRY